MAGNVVTLLQDGRGQMGDFELAVQERQSQARSRPQLCPVVITLSLFKKTPRSLPSPGSQPFLSEVASGL